ncbi:MAG: hypothetical protein PHP30_01545 [Bacteroidales bacterium]|nr:hypothetical protein [Bacteroidales bacterium]
MKTVLSNLILFESVLLAAVLSSCLKEENPVTEIPDVKSDIIFNGNEIGNGNQEYEIIGDKIIKAGTYTLKGWVYITDGATLTIEPGTIIKGDKATKAALIVERGGKIMAQGTLAKPIVFTSAQPAGERKPGDWGGLIICGKATNNKTEMIIEGGPRSRHGGSNDNDNSGVLSFVRIEFAGYPFKTDQEINGLTLGSVGSGTKIDHIQVSYSNDDSYEWFGGTVNSKYLVSYHGWDDDFDTDSGFRGKVQFGLIVRNPLIADKSISNGFESDNSSDAPNQQPVTQPIFSNITLIGPSCQDPAFENNSSYITAGAFNPNNGSKLGQFQSAVQIRRGSNLSLFNSVAVGYPVGLMICNDKGSQTQKAATEGKISFKNNLFAAITITGSDKDASFKDSLSVNASTFDKEASNSFSTSFFNLISNGNTLYNNSQSLMLAQLSSLLPHPNWGPLPGSPLTNRENLFNESSLSDIFFDKVTFVGAFRSEASVDNWTMGWTNFDPQHTSY